MAKRFTLFLALLSFSGISCSDDASLAIQGAGATFPAPLYKRWFLEYYKRNPNVRINYQAIGSGAGIRQFTEQLVNFAASDAAMTDAEIAKVERGVLMLPMTAGSIAIAYNLPGYDGELKLSRKVLAAIFLGEITNWNSPQIAEANPGSALPDTEITVVRRSEGSGTTFAFTNHLSAVSPEWKKEVGVSKSVDKWKVGIGSKGNNGVAATIQQTPGTIGYIETGYAELAHLKMASIQNKAGKFRTPTAENAKAAIATAKLPDNLRQFITDPEGDDAYPIVTFTWLLCYCKYDDQAIAAAIKDMVRFGLTEGQQWSAELGYVPLPETIVKRVLAAADKIGDGK